MANSFNLTPGNISQAQIDALIDIIHALNPMVVNSIVAKPNGILVGDKEFIAVCRAEKVFDKLTIKRE
jgi:hypothetical protein